MPNKLITITEAAATLGVSLDTLRRWDKSEILKSVRAGERGHRLYRQEDIDLLTIDLFHIAKKWATNKHPQDPNQDFFCQNSAVFQSRLGRMETALSKILSISKIYSLLVAIAGEIGNNSFDHNLGNWPDILGILFAYDPAKKIIVLADRGQGILKTLKRVKPSLKNDEEALRLAFTEKISGRAPENRGNGLKFVRKVISEYPFNLTFYSGTAKLEIKAGNNEIFTSETTEKFHGCIAQIKF